MTDNPIRQHFEDNFLAFYQHYMPGVEFKKEGNSDNFVAKCPFHEESDPSFTIRGDIGLFLCFGCKAKGDWAHFYARMHGMDSKRDFNQIVHGVAKDFNIPIKNNGFDKEKRFVCAYDYTDESGNLLKQVCRYEDPNGAKEFKQRQPGENGGWIYKVKGVQDVLFNLQKLKWADDVLIVEGEKDALNVQEKLGITATTCAGGSGKWKTEYSEQLRGKHVTLCPDNDEPGRKHMQQVALELEGKVGSLKWLDLPDIPEKGDISDWLERYDDMDRAGEDLCRMIDGLEPYSPPRPPTIGDAVVRSDEFTAIKLPKREVILSPWLLKLSIVLISAWRGMGKTMLAIALARAITTAQSFGPWRTITPVPTLLVDAEMSAQEYQERLNGFDYGHEQKEPLYVYSDAYATQLGLPRAHLANEEWRLHMKNMVVEKGIELMILDNISSLSSGLDENSKQDWDPVNSWLLDLRFAGVSTILLHHFGKRGTQRGTSAREDNIDISIELKKASGYVQADGCRFVLSFSKARVPTKDLPLITDREFQLATDENGRYTWTFNSAKKNNKAEIIRLLSEGATNGVIAKQLDVSKSYVTKIKNHAIDDGLLNKDGITLTGNGKIYVDDTKPGLFHSEE